MYGRWVILRPPFCRYVGFPGPTAFLTGPTSVPTSGPTSPDVLRLGSSRLPDLAVGKERPTRLGVHFTLIRLRETALWVIGTPSLRYGSASISSVKNWRTV